jgi:hypothetical protein
MYWECDKRGSILVSMRNVPQFKLGLLLINFVQKSRMISLVKSAIKLRRPCMVHTMVSCPFCRQVCAECLNGGFRLQTCVQKDRRKGTASLLLLTAAWMLWNMEANANATILLA